MPNMVHGADVIHLEADVHATADNIYAIRTAPGSPISPSPIRSRSRLRLEGLRNIEADDRQGRAALRRQCRDERPGTYKVTYAFKAAGGERVLPPHRSGNRGAGLVAAFLPDLHLRLSAEVGFFKRNPAAPIMIPRARCDAPRKRLFRHLWTAGTSLAPRPAGAAGA